MKARWLLMCVLVTACASLPERDSAPARLYEAKCGNCHSAFPPQDHSRLQWQRLLKLMERGMSHKEMPPLNPQERRVILDYLTRHGRPAPEDQEEPLKLPYK